MRTFRELIQEDFSLEDAAKKLEKIRKDFETDIANDDSETKVVNNTIKLTIGGEYEDINYVTRNKDYEKKFEAKLRKLKWLNKYFDWTSREIRHKVTVQDDYYILVTREYTFIPKDDAPIAYDNLEEELSTISQEGLRALRRQLKNPKELIKLLDKLIK